VRELSEKTLNELDQYFHDVIVSQVSENELKRKIAFKWIPKAENNILGFVYFFAACLVVVLGLRGLGDQMPFDFLKDASGRLNIWIIVIALAVEFIAILLLAFTMFFKPEEIHSLVHEFRRTKGIGNRDGVDQIVKDILLLNGKSNTVTTVDEELENKMIVEKGLREIFEKLSVFSNKQSNK
jgi:hypothetical protein